MDGERHKSAAAFAHLSSESSSLMMCRRKSQSSCRKSGVLRCAVCHGLHYTQELQEPRPGALRIQTLYAKFYRPLADSVKSTHKRQR